MTIRCRRRHDWSPWRWVDEKRGPVRRRRCRECGLVQTRPGK